MTNEERDLLIAYLADAGELDPKGGVEAQFQDWYQVREGQVSGEVFYKAVLDAARIKQTLRENPAFVVVQDEHGRYSERHMDIENDAALVQAIRDTLNGRLGFGRYAGYAEAVLFFDDFSGATRRRMVPENRDEACGPVAQAWGRREAP